MARGNGDARRERVSLPVCLSGGICRPASCYSAASRWIGDRLGAPASRRPANSVGQRQGRSVSSPPVPSRNCAPVSPCPCRRRRAGGWSPGCRPLDGVAQRIRSGSRRAEMSPPGRSGGPHPSRLPGGEAKSLETRRSFWRRAVAADFASSLERSPRISGDASSLERSPRLPGDASSLEISPRLQKDRLESLETPRLQKHRLVSRTLSRRRGDRLDFTASHLRGGDRTGGVERSSRRRAASPPQEEDAPASRQLHRMRQAGGREPFRPCWCEAIKPA